MSQKETDRQLKETSMSQKETDRQLKETSMSQKETDRQLKKSDKRIAELNELFTGQWGKLMEALVKGELINLLQKRNIKVQNITQESSGMWKNKSFEFDIIAVNGSEVVVTEVKTTLQLKDLTYFIGKLKNFKKMLSQYDDKKVYGAVSFILRPIKVRLKELKKKVFL